MPRTSAVHYINPSSISIVPNANGSQNDLAVYVTRDAKIRAFSPKAGIETVDASYREWTLGGRNRRLADSTKPYTIYARLSKTDNADGYIVFAPMMAHGLDWRDKYPHVTVDGLSTIDYIPGGDVIENIENYWYIRIGEVTLPENGERSVIMDTGILGTDQYNAEFDVLPDDLPLRVSIGCTVDDEDAGPTPYLYWGKAAVLHATLMEGWNTTDVERFDHWEITRNTGDSVADKAWPAEARAEAFASSGSIILSHERGGNDDFNGAVSAIFTVTAWGKLSEDTASSDNADDAPELEVLQTASINIMAETFEKYELALDAVVVSYNPQTQAFTPSAGIPVRLRATDQRGDVFSVTFGQMRNAALAVAYAPVGGSSWVPLVFAGDDASEATATIPVSAFSAQKSLNVRLANGDNKELALYTIAFVRDGEDSREREWIFFRSATAITFGDSASEHVKPSLISRGEVNPTGEASGNDTNKNQNGWVPQGWWDDLQGTNEQNPYEYGSYRDYIHGDDVLPSAWGEFTMPKLWSHYGEDGVPSVVYTILPSENAIHVVRTDTGYASPTGGKFVSLRAGYKRSEGNVITMVEDATEQFSGQTIYFRRHLRSTGEWETYYYSYANATNRRAMVVVPDAATSGLNVDMYDMVEFSISSSTASVATALEDVKDRMTVPVIADGADGADGEQGEQGEQGESGAPAEFYSLEIQGGISSVDFSANFAGIITARPSQVTLLLRHVVGNTQEYLSDVPAGMTLEHLLDNDTWETTFLGIRATEDDLSDGTYDTAYRLMRGSTVISTVSLSSHWSYQRMLLPTGRWDATKTYERTPTTTPLVLYAREDGGDDCYYFLDADRAQGSSGQNKPAMSGSYWQLANEYDVVLTKMLFAQFAQLGGYIVYDKYFFSRFGTLVAADGSETVIDNETAALTDVTGQKGGSSFTAIPYGWFDPSDPMPSGTHSPSTSYKFRPMKCINAMSGEEWASGGNVHFSDNGDVDINGTIRTKNLYRSVALCWGQVDAVGGVKTCTLEPGGAAKTYLYVKSLKNEDSPALAAKYGFKPGDYFEYTSEMKNSADADGFDGGMSWSDINDNDFVPCTYSADLVELLDNTERGAFYPYEGTVYLPLPQTFLGKRIEVRHNNTEGTARALVKTVDPTQNYFMLCPELDGHGDLKPSGDTTSSSVTMLAGQTAFFYSVGTYWLYFPSGGGERDINERCKGLYLTAAKLSGAQPSPRVGDWAYVGNGFPATIYVCEVAGTWTNSGQTYDGGSVSLTDYATKAYVHGRFRLLSEADYEQIERQGLTDDTILYMTPEE